MLKPPIQPVPQDAATVAFDLLSDVLEESSVISTGNRFRVSLAMQVLNGDLTPTQALDRADERPVLR